MSNFGLHPAFLLLVCLFNPLGAFPSGVELGGNRTRRDVTCRHHLEYPNGNICCLNCPAGTRVSSPCTRPGEMGKCEECDYGTYTEHDNGLKQCFKCTKCRSDQEIVTPCAHIHNTECQCKSGRFCDPDQACEVCKRCSKCGNDETIVRNCTATTNTDCKKIPLSRDSASVSAGVIAALSLGAVAVAVVTVMLLRRRCRATDSPRDSPDEHKVGQLTDVRRDRETQSPRFSSLFLSGQLVRAKSSADVEEERKVLCESLSSSASNSQHSLTAPPPPATPALPPRAGPTVPVHPDRREDEPFPNLVPKNGEESLRKCFEYFEEMDINYHKRFFRSLGISDNYLKSKEQSSYEDSVHEYLSFWIEKEGKEACLNDLLKALLDLNQRRTAETIKERAIQDGHYSYESE